MDSQATAIHANRKSKHANGPHGRKADKECRMRFCKVNNLCLVLLAFTSVASPALAQSDTVTRPAQPNAAAAEVTAFVSMGSSPSSRVGTAISFPVSSDLSVEAELGYQDKETGSGALSSNISLLYSLPAKGRFSPYLAAGIGLQEFDKLITQPGSEVATMKELAVSVNAGGGVKVPVDDRWGFRTDARWNKAVVNSEAEGWRLYQGISRGFGKRD